VCLQEQGRKRMKIKRNEMIMMVAAVNVYISLMMLVRGKKRE
jgi:ABC-type lipoprotein release transport system permease subunit